MSDAFNRTLLAGFLALWCVDVSAADAAPATATDPAPEQCGVLFESAPGQFDNQMLPALHVQSMSPSDTFALPADAPANVRAVQCGRTSLVPTDTDYKVLVAGLPLVLVVDARMGVFDIEEGRVRFQMLEGEMTEAEIALVGPLLDRSQEALLALESTAQPASAAD